MIYCTSLAKEKLKFYLCDLILVSEGPVSAISMTMPCNEVAGCLGRVGTDFAQGHLHSTRAPADSDSV